MSELLSTELNGYMYLQNGPSSKGWERSEEIYYRCGHCGSLMHSLTSKDFSCKCKAMFVDQCASRFGSKYGDKDIMVYKKSAREGFSIQKVFNL